MTSIETLELFFLIVTAIFVEAAPFLLMGALIGSFIEVVVPTERLLKYIPKGPVKGIALGLSAGMILPTCECGVVPIVRRLMAKGVPSHVAVTYLLAAPVINPIVMISTYIAFRGNYWMVLGRVLLVAFPAIIIGLMVKGVSLGKLVRRGYDDLPMISSCKTCNHDPCPDHDHDADQVMSGFRTKAGDILVHAGSEFLDMSRFLILGAVASALFKILLPQEMLAYFSQNIFLAVGSMMALAILLSICSEADAFVASSFNFFPPLAQLSFVAIGPMVDLKLIGMYGAAFHKRLALLLILVPTLFIYVATMALSYFIGKT
jgi:uncharacterized protein